MKQLGWPRGSPMPSGSKRTRSRWRACPSPSRVIETDHDTILCRQRAFGYTDEDLRMLLTPMAVNGQEPVGSMGTDTPLACLSDQPQPLFNYFKQLFAQVTNPADRSDSRRDGDVAHQLYRHRAQHPGRDAAALPHAEAAASDPDQPRPGKTAPRVAGAISWPPRCRRSSACDGGEKGLERALDGLCRRASLAIKSGYTLLILSDRGVDEEYAPIPSLLALTAVHNHLVREEHAHAGRADRRIGRAARGDALLPC